MSKDEDKLSDAKAAFQECVDAESENREEALDDLRFARLSEQWDTKVAERRRLEGRPCLTINRLPSFIRQVVNDVRQNRPQIKVQPVDSEADRATADIISGLIRNIEAQSRADTAYDTAVDFAATMGWGYVRVDLDYAHDDSFDLDICIKRVPNPFTIYADPRGTSADSSDWNCAFATELLSKDEFEKRYKDAEPASWWDNGYDGMDVPWRDGDDVLLAEHWYREEVTGTILKLSNGVVINEDDYERQRDLLEVMGISVVAQRETKRWSVKQCIMTGAEIIEENKWVGKFIPIVPVYGEELNIEGKRIFKSLIRDAKDAQRMFNYWRTTTTELVALAPKAPYIGRTGAFDRDREKWETANSQSHAFLEYDSPEMPQRQPFSGVPAGALQEALNASDDMKSIMGMYDASLGARSNETSGRAILARQREGDVGTFHFADNLSRAIRHVGAILIDLIPHVYTAPRVLRTIGQEGEVASVPLGQPVAVGPDGRPMQQGGAGPQQGQGGMAEGVMRVFDLSSGKYDLTVTSGPSFTTRRDEAATQMIEMLRAFPAAAPIIGDIVAKNLDWPGADEIERRMKAMLPPQLQGPDPKVAAIVRENEELKRALAEMQGDKSIDQAKVEVDRFDAQTGRMKVVGELALKAAQPKPQPQAGPYGRPN